MLYGIWTNEEMKLFANTVGKTGGQLLSELYDIHICRFRRTVCILTVVGPAGGARRAYRETQHLAPLDAPKASTSGYSTLKNQKHIFKTHVSFGHFNSQIHSCIIMHTRRVIYSGAPVISAKRSKFAGTPPHIFTSAAQLSQRFLVQRHTSPDCLSSYFSGFAPRSLSAIPCTALGFEPFLSR